YHTALAEQDAAQQSRDARTQARALSQARSKVAAARQRLAGLGLDPDELTGTSEGAARLAELLDVPRGTAQDLLTAASGLLRPPVSIGWDPRTQQQRAVVHAALARIAESLHRQGEDAARETADLLVEGNPALRSADAGPVGGAPPRRRTAENVADRTSRAGTSTSGGPSTGQLR
ncbi:hypothetical protein NGM37_32790, partial [Streptomyces sp. TRM76130]|nr:hypothetical protein [Streptomyces sp. TRM76130]